MRGRDTRKKRFQVSAGTPQMQIRKGLGRCDLCHTAAYANTSHSTLGLGDGGSGKGNGEGLNLRHL